MTNREYIKQLLDDRSEEGADQLSERLNCPPHYIDYSDGCTGICRRGQECDQCQQEWLDMEADEKMTKHCESKEELEACSFEQIQTLINAAKKHGFVNYIPLFFIKNYSPQVLKANMRVVGATEHALLFYRGRLPKFRNGVQVDENGKNIPNTGHMVFNWFNWEKDGKEIPKIHPAQKPVKLLRKLIETFTDEGDVVIDPCCGSGSTLRASHELGRNAFGFEIDRNFYNRAKEEMLDFSNEQFAMEWM